MKVIITTSNKYHHLLKISIFLFKKFWGNDQEVEIVGYNKPSFELPSNFTFISLGEQKGGPENFGGDLRGYFERQDDCFVWMFDDTFLWRSVNFDRLDFLKNLISKESNIGRVYLTRDILSQKHKIINTYHSETDSFNLLEQDQDSNYRLSTQPSIWRRDFLLKYLTPGLSPWQFETQLSINDGWRILGLDSQAVFHNEGVTKRDIYDYNFDRIPQDIIDEMIKLDLITR